jgi:hypothetical protein
MTAGEVSFPDGVVVRGAAVTDRETNADWRDYGLYLDARWAPTWPATVLDWPDFGLPTSDADAIRAIEEAFDRARAGRNVEVGCAGGRGRTGTVLAGMAVLAGVAAPDAVTWVRDRYDPRAVEGSAQEAWVLDLALRRDV